MRHQIQIDRTTSPSAKVTALVARGDRCILFAFNGRYSRQAEMVHDASHSILLTQVPKCPACSTAHSRNRSIRLFEMLKKRFPDFSDASVSFPPTL